MRFSSFVGVLMITAFVAGCGSSAGTSSPSSGGNKGISSATFKIVVMGETAVLDPATNTTITLPGGGLVAQDGRAWC